MSLDIIEDELQAVYNDIDVLKQGRIREIASNSSFPKYSTLANRLLKNFTVIVEAYDNEIEYKTELRDKEEFDLLDGMLSSLSSEIASLVKKQPDELVNKFKVSQINRVLRPLKDYLSQEPSNCFLEIVTEPEEMTEKSRNSYSDVAIILCQYREACIKYRRKRNKDGWTDSIL